MVLKKADMMDFRPQFISSYVSTDAKILELAGESSRGLVGTMIFDTHRGNRYAELLYATHDRVDPDRRVSTSYQLGYAIAEVLVEGLRRAGRDLTREGLMEAMETFDHWSDYTGSPLTYGPDYRGGRSSAIYMVKANLETGTLDKLTDWIPFEMPVKLADNGE